jgi:hypothetical protein
MAGLRAEAPQCLGSTALPPPAQTLGVDDSGGVTGAAGHVRDAGGVEGFGPAHGRAQGNQPPRQHRLPRPSRDEPEDIVGITPTSCSALHPRLEFMSGRMAAVLPERDQRCVIAKLMVRALWAR